MKSCVICGDPVEHSSHDFCDKCFHSKIDDLQRNYGKVKGPSDPAKESREAPVSEPLTENTHR